jgi:hypothetical protein
VKQETSRSKRQAERYNPEDRAFCTHRRENLKISEVIFLTIGLLTAALKGDLKITIYSTFATRRQDKKKVKGDLFMWRMMYSFK